jgi:hypothetical protein
LVVAINCPTTAPTIDVFWIIEAVFKHFGTCFGGKIFAIVLWMFRQFTGTHREWVRQSSFWVFVPVVRDVFGWVYV